MRRRKPDPNRDCFVLKLGGSIPWENLPNRGVFAVYDKLPNSLIHPALCFVVRGLPELRERLKPLSQSGTREVFVETAESETELMDWDYEHLVWRVLQGIETIKRRGDSATLRRVRAAIESKGEKPGPKVNPEKNEWLIGVLKELAAGKPMKEIPLPHPWKPASVSAILSRFCWGFYHLCTLFGANSPDKWQGDYVARIIKKRFGFSFPDNLAAAQEAFRRGEAQLSAEDRQRFDSVSVRYRIRQL
jgi:hypothetical protein